jgi:hypothetical protein
VLADVDMQVLSVYQHRRSPPLPPCNQLATIVGLMRWSPRCHNERTGPHSYGIVTTCLLRTQTPSPACCAPTPATCLLLTHTRTRRTHNAARRVGNVQHSLKHLAAHIVEAAPHHGAAKQHPVQRLSVVKRAQQPPLSRFS